ncbi:acyl-CoA dehydrogenase family protein [Blastococcus saxobsidens]|uniref:Alkylation response protein AidB-like acyl-CoA dehydrogenase n=1 Tax=Blastococcus saxobsidens TaxID=138336 RepID=A0A4Q7Y659_9ACTN|nr:acyl-CoA dehydrogenase family protein [Blastococcus saxobsidens]RZU32380.1 alkylation response protein AidB-like acyl-CoA dehydrogenase [Blastococcus saxobsidens]
MTGPATDGVLDTDPHAYLALHGALDEEVADALLDPREREVRDRTREVVAEHVAPGAAARDRDHVFAHDSYQALARAGLGGLLVPEEYGGTADGTVAYAAAMEEITAGCPATSLVYMTQMHAAYPILHAGTAELAQRYVPGLVDGSRYGSLGVTEPGAGSDASSLRTLAVADTGADGLPTGYAITGSKTFITTGDRSDVVVCFATVDPRAGRRGITAFVVDGDAPGLSRGAPMVKTGMHGSTTAEVFFDRTPVPVTHRLGGEGEGWAIVVSSVTKSRISAAAQGVGLARGAYAHALAALHRAHGGELPPDTAFALADMRSAILRGRLTLLGVAREVDRTGGATGGAIALMKQACTDIGWQVAVAATKVLGRVGDLAASGVERYLRDAKVTQIYDGTNEVQRLLIARDTAGRLKGALR